ncbi:MAG: hypothetical protein R3E62_05745 [Pseudomonadales bacterium]
MTERKKLGLQQPSNEHDFKTMMLTVDSYLKERNLKPFQRPMNALLQISGELQLGLQVTPKEREVKLGCYTGNSLSARIFNWYDEVYGNALNMPLLGRFFILIKNDPWIVRAPLIYGTVGFFAHPNLPSSDVAEDLRLRRIPEVNILGLVDEMPGGLKKILTATDLASIGEQFQICFPAIQKLTQLHELKFVSEALSDIDAAVNHACSKTPHYGQSKWSSLRATEKVLKAFIHANEGEIKTDHELKKHVKIAERCGLPSVDRDAVSKIRCKADISYGELPCSLYEAHAAHINSCRIILHVASNFIKN